MTANRRELKNPVYFYRPDVPFNGGYGANPTTQVPYVVNEGTGMYYPTTYHAFPCPFRQDPLRPPWNATTQAASAAQSALNSHAYPYPSGYIYIDSKYCCGPSATSYTAPVDPVVGVDGSSSSQTQPVHYAPVVPQFPTKFSPSQSASRQEKFISTVPRKVHITRQAKYGWNFSNAQLHSLVECCIARKRDADGNPTSLRTFSSQLESVENPRARDGTYKGYAILTFESPEAAKIAVDALNHEGQFSAKIDKDQLPASPMPHRDSHFFWRLIEDCIPSSFATISACGIPMYNSIEKIDFPTRVDGTSEGYAYMKFNYDVVANIVVGALQARGFNAYVTQGEIQVYCQAMTATQPPAQNFRRVWSPPPKEVPQAVPRPRNPRGVPKVAQAAKTIRNQAAVKKANNVCQNPHVQMVDPVQPTPESPISPILGHLPSSPMPRSASVTDGYGSWYNTGSGLEEGRRSV